MDSEELCDKIGIRAYVTRHIDPNEELNRLWYDESTGMVLYYDGWHRHIVDDLSPCADNIQHLTLDTLNEYEL
jgi:hypothetical protein